MEETHLAQSGGDGDAGDPPEVIRSAPGATDDGQAVVVLHDSKPLPVPVEELIMSTKSDRDRHPDVSPDGAEHLRDAAAGGLPFECLGRPARPIPVPDARLADRSVDPVASGPESVRTGPPIGPQELSPQ